MSAQPKVSHFPKPKPRPVAHVDTDMLGIEHGTPLPAAARSSAPSKYDAKFDKLKPGSCIVCEFGERGTVVTALIKYIKRKGLNCTTKSLGRCQDGHARVWMVSK